MNSILKKIAEIIVFMLVLTIGVFIKFLQAIGIMKKKVYVDDIDNKKVKANLAFLEQGIYIGFDDELDELLKFKTKSIEKIDLLGGVPPAFNNNEFIACYPDVIVWWNGLSMEDRDEMMDSFDDKDLEKRKDELLRKIIDAYKNTGAKLECSYD